MAAFSVLLDLGRPWLTWKLPVFVADWNLDSVLLEVALCVIAYTLVLWIELAPAFLEKAEESSVGALRRLGAAWRPRLERALLWITALGLLLPTMHQSSLGSLLMISGPRLDPLWNSPVLPLLFLISCIGMGYGAVVLESTLAERLLGRGGHRAMLAGLGAAMLPIGGSYLAVRVVDLVVRGQLGALFAGDITGTMCLVELVLFAAPLWMLRSRAQRREPRVLWRAALTFLLAGALYRFDVYLLAFSPGAHWSYFPSVSEILITLGLVAGEVAAYIFLVKRFPILAGRSRPAPAH
jgi:Ni/Fe-hydrogenase subunit HybB-like protein